MQIEKNLERLEKNVAKTTVLPVYFVTIFMARLDIHKLLF